MTDDRYLVGGEANLFPPESSGWDGAGVLDSSSRMEHCQPYSRQQYSIQPLQFLAQGKILVTRQIETGNTSTEVTVQGLAIQVARPSRHPLHLPIVTKWRSIPGETVYRDVPRKLEGGCEIAQRGRGEDLVHHPSGGSPPRTHCRERGDLRIQCEYRRGSSGRPENRWYSQSRIGYKSARHLRP